jgi:hypothetical protein
VQGGGSELQRMPPLGAKRDRRGRLSLLPGPCERWRSEWSRSASSSHPSLYFLRCRRRFAVNAPSLTFNIQAQSRCRPSSFFSSLPLGRAPALARQVRLLRTHFSRLCRVEQSAATTTRCRSSIRWRQAPAPLSSACDIGHPSEQNGQSSSRSPSSRVETPKDGHTLWLGG